MFLVGYLRRVGERIIYRKLYLLKARTAASFLIMRAM
jgi:hypothetical protein